MKSLLLCLVCLSVLLRESAAFQLPAFSLNNLLTHEPETVAGIQQAMSKIGMFAVTDSSYENEQTQSLQELVECIRSGSATGHSQDVVLKDQTLRTTIAALTNASHTLPFPAELEARCSAFVRHSHSLRQAAAIVGQGYAQVLDSVGSDPSLRGPYTEAVQMAESLEHFHLFRQREPRGQNPALQLHKDMGMFLVMTPPHYFELETTALPNQPVPSGFRLQLPDGQVVHPEFPAGSLIVMNGDGVVTWFASPAAAQLYVPPHEVILPAFPGLGRAWYGRMFLPLRQSRRQTDDTTFQQFWADSSAAAMTRAPGAQILLQAPEVEGPHRQLLQVVPQGNCSDGFLYCWHMCIAITNVTDCTPECSDPNGLLWPENYTLSNGTELMCPSCTLRCSSAAVNIPSGLLLVTLLVLLSSATV